MRLDHSFHRRSVSIVLVLVLSLLGFLPQLAHASTYVGYTTTQTGALTCNTFGNCEKCQQDGTPGVKCGTGSAIQSPLTGTLTSVTLVTGSSVPNQLEIATFPAGTTPASTTLACGYSGQTYNCQQVTDGQSFTVKDVEGLSGLTGQTLTTIALASPVSVTSGQFVAVQFTNTGATTFGLVNQVCSNNVGTSCGSIVATGVWDLCLDFQTASPTINAVVASAGQNNGGCGVAIFTGATFTPTGQSGNTVTVTQCYGNCGTPAITLANTNSTHGINFNQSITVFYEFQSNLNGFVVNVTTSIAKTYSNGQTPSLALYFVTSCPAGQLPFTNQCPGLQYLGGTPQGSNPQKGRLTLGAGGQYAVSNGEWVGIAVTGSFSGLDLNDTNTNINLFQTSGQIPPSITQSNPATSLCAGCKMGLWAWITGNVVTGASPSPNIGTSCSGFLDCIVPNLVFSLCSNQTTQCQNVSALLWAILLSMFFTFFVWKMGANIMPGARLPFGEIFLLMTLVWIFVMSGLTLLFVWVPLFFFFLISLFVGKKTGVYL